MTEWTALLSLHIYRITVYRSTKAAAKPPANPIPLLPIFTIAAPELLEVCAADVGVEVVPVVGACVVPPVVELPVVAAAAPELEVVLQTTWSGTSTGGSAVAQMVFAYAMASLRPVSSHLSRRQQAMLLRKSLLLQMQFVLRLLQPAMLEPVVNSPTQGC